MRAKVGDELHRYAARYSLDAEQLVRWARMVRGVEVTKVSREQAILINQDTALRRARHRRPASVREVPRRAIVALQPGDRWAIDAWHSSIECGVTGHVMGLHFVDLTSNAGYAFSATTDSVEVWTEAGQDWWLAEQALGHTPKCIYVDAGIFRSTGARRELQMALKVQVLPGGGDEHEWVSQGEAMMDTYTRRTSAAMLRATVGGGAPESMMLKCRIYQVVVANHVPVKGRRATRWQEHTGGVAPNLAHAHPLFYTQVSITNIGGARRPKGMMDSSKSHYERTGNIIGADMTEYSYVLTTDTKEEVKRATKDCTLLNENVLLASGLGAKAAVRDQEVQLDAANELPLAYLPVPQPRVRAEPKEVVRYVVDELNAIEVGTEIDVMWKEPTGPLSQPWRAICTQIDESNGKKLHTLRYPEWPESTPGGNEWSHDLVRDRLTGEHAWWLARERRAESKQKKKVRVEEPVKKGKTERVTRSQAKEQATAAAAR